MKGILENVRLHLKSIEKSRREARKDAAIYSNQGSALLEGWEHGRDIGLYSGKVRMGYIYKSLRQLESEGR